MGPGGWGQWGMSGKKRWCGVRKLVASAQHIDNTFYVAYKRAPVGPLVDKSRFDISEVQ